MPVCHLIKEVQCQESNHEGTAHSFCLKQHIQVPKPQYSSAEKGKETNTHELMQDLSERVVE